MNKLIRLLVLPIALSTGVTLLPGCGGSSNAPVLITGTAALAGTYNGTFQGTTTPASGNPGQPVSGTFSAISQTNGTVTGTVSQGGQTSPITGKVDDMGNFSVSGFVAPGQTATLNGRLTLASGSSTFTGTFTTTNSNGATVATGTASGNRTSTATG